MTFPTILDRLRKPFTRTVTVVKHVPVFALDLPKHDEWAHTLVIEALRRSGGNVRAAAKLIGRSEGYVRKVGRCKES